MSNSQNKRNIKAGNKSTGGSGNAKGKPAATGGKSNTTGPKVGNRKPAGKDKALADARKAASGSNSKMTLWIVAAVVVVALAAAGIFAVVQSNSDKEAAAAALDLGAGTVSAEEGTITWGEPADATVENWLDLLCPACRQYEESTAELMGEAVNNGDAQLVVHPTGILNNSSNPPGYSSRASSALMCAGDKPQGYKFMQALFENQPAQGGPGLSDAELADLAEEVGLSDEWNTCYESGEFDSVAEENTERFDENGYPGTPTIVVNGEQLTSNNPAELEEAIAAAQS